MNYRALEFYCNPKVAHWYISKMACQNILQNCKDLIQHNANALLKNQHKIVCDVAIWNLWLFLDSSDLIFDVWWYNRVFEVVFWYQSGHQGVANSLLVGKRGELKLKPESFFLFFPSLSSSKKFFMKSNLLWEMKLIIQH